MLPFPQAIRHRGRQSVDPRKSRLLRGRLIGRGRMLRVFRHHMAYSSLLLGVIEGLIVFYVSFHFSDLNFAEFAHNAGGIDERLGVAALWVFCLLLLMGGFGLSN